MKPVIFCLLLAALCGFISAETYITENISTSQTWTQTGSPYVINGDITVYGEPIPTLTIQAGVVVKFTSGSSLIIGSNSSSYGGAIVASGTQVNPVLFTADTGTPVEGFWDCLRTNSYTYATSTFAHAIFEYGGSDLGMFNVNNSQADHTPQFDHCTFRHSANYGLYHIRSSETIGASVQNCAFENNLGYPLQANANQVYKIGAGNTFSGNNPDRILLRNVKISTPQTWLNHDVSYEAENDLSVQMSSGEALEISEGAELCFREGKSLIVGYVSNSYNGGLVCTGVTFRSCDSGSWEGIYFRAYITASTLNSCEVRDVVSTVQGAVYMQNLNADVNIANCLFTANDGYGVYAANNSKFSITGTSFEQNGMTVSAAAMDICKLGSENTYLANTDNRIHCRGGYISEGVQWINQGTPILVGSNLTARFAEPGALSLPWGMILEFSSGTYIKIGYVSSTYTGSLSATGVVFRGESSTPGYWQGLIFDSYGGNSLLSGCIISDAGYNGQPAVYFKVPAATMTGCQVVNCLAVGVDYYSNSVQVALSGNNISGCGAYPLSLPASCVRAIGQGNDFTGNALDKVEVRSEVISESCTWIDPGVPYYLNGTTYVRGNPNSHLKILPGTVLYLPAGGTLSIGYVGSSYYGSLEAEGVTFTSDPEAGVSQGLLFSQYIEHSLCILEDCTFEGMQNSSYNTAVYVENSLPTFISCTFQNNPGSGIAGSAAARFTLTDCSFLNNGHYPVRTSAPAFEAVSGTGNSFSGNTPNRIQISGGTLDQDYEWNNPSVPVEVTSNINVRSSIGCTLKINSGLVLLFQSGTGIYVGYVSSSSSGSIQADGSTFSALNGSTGGWEGITLNTYLTGGDYLRNCVVEYGGGYGNIYLNNSALSYIDGCVIRYGTHGIYAMGASSNPNITKNYIFSNGTGVYCAGNANPIIGGETGDGNNIEGNTDFGVQNTSSGITVNAENNWWGHEYGPTHSGNPAGQGDIVSDYVDYDPYRDTDIGDAPAGFHLLTPANASVLETLEPVLDWEEAIDPTPGDTVLYTLEIAENSTFTAGLITVSDLAASVYHVPEASLDDDSRYYWRVKATDTQEQTTLCYENYWYFDTAVPQAPLAFDPVSPAYNATLEFTSNLLSWEEAIDPDPGDMITYTLYQDISADFENAQTFETTHTQIYSGFCAPGSLIYWKVKATDLTNRETFSPTWRFFVDHNAKPRYPVEFTLTTSGSDIQIIWDAVPGADSYDIYLSNDPYTGFSLLQPGLGTNQYLHIGAAAEPRKFYYVTAHDTQ